MASPEFMTFATRVLERGLQKAGYLPVPALEAGAMPDPDAMLVDSMADKLLAFVSNADATIVPLLQAAITTPALDQLRNRNQRFARALGACECFGDDVTCTRCGGRGSSGWDIPDRSQFEAIVRPTLQRISQFRLPARNGHVHSHSQ